MTLHLSILTALSLALNLVLFSPDAHARGKEKVVSLAQGACWVSQSSGPRSTRLASFNQRLSLRLSGNYFSEAIEKLEGQSREELSRGLHWSKGEAFIHCSAQASFTVLNVPIEGSNQRVCAWIELRADGPRLSSWGFARGEGFCDGARPGEYVLSLEKGVGESELEKYLSRAPWHREVLELERLSTEHWFLKVNPAASLERSNPLREELVESGLFRAVERQSFYHPVGESLKIQSPLGR